MPSFYFILALALFVAPNARANDWTDVGCNSEECVQVRVVERRQPYVTFERQTVGTNTIFKQVADCQRYRLRTIAIDGKPYSKGWRDTVPGSFGEGLVTSVCQL